MSKDYTCVLGCVPSHDVVATGAIKLPNSAAGARCLEDSRPCRRSGAKRNLIHGLPIFTIRLPQWGFPDNSSPGPALLWTMLMPLATSLLPWLLAYHMPVTSLVALRLLPNPPAITTVSRPTRESSQTAVYRSQTLNFSLLK